MGLIKDRNGMDLTEAEDIKKRWQEYTEELYKKELHDPDNHDGGIEAGHGDEQGRKEDEHAVKHRVMLHRRQHAEGNADDQGYEQGDKAQLARRRERLPNDIRHRVAGFHHQGRAQIALQQRFEVAHVLHGDRLVIANTLFQKHKRRLYTWTSPDGQHQNQID